MHPIQELVRRVPAFIYCLVADENVFAIYGEKFIEQFNKTGKTLYVKVVPSGETTKDRRVKEEIEDFMLSVWYIRVTKANLHKTWKTMCTLSHGDLCTIRVPPLC
jgi:3-dehydroquinate synthetase